MKVKEILPGRDGTLVPVTYSDYEIGKGINIGYYERSRKSYYWPVGKHKTLAEAQEWARKHISNRITGYAPNSKQIKKKEREIRLMAKESLSDKETKIDPFKPRLNPQGGYKPQPKPKPPMVSIDAILSEDSKTERKVDNMPKSEAELIIKMFEVLKQHTEEIKMLKERVNELERENLMRNPLG